MSSQNELFDNYRFIAWKNTDSNTCPPFGCFAETGTGTSAGGVYVTGRRHNSTFVRKSRFNGPYAVPQNKWGICFDSRTAIAITNGTPTADTTLGPKADSWELWPDYPAVADVIGAIDVSAKTALVEWYPVDFLYGKLAGSLSQGSTATLNIWTNASTPAVITSWTVTVRDRLMKSGATAIASGKQVFAKWGYGNFFATNAECA
jgi:hypothetical protein